MLTDGCGVEGFRVLVVVLQQRTGKKCKHRHSMMMHAAQGVWCVVGRALATRRHKIRAATFNGIGLEQRRVLC